MSNSSNPSVSQAQATDESVTGAVRVAISRHGAAPSTSVGELPAADRSAYVVRGALRINPGTNQQTSMDTTRVSVGGAADLSGDSGILATARTPAFNGPAHEIKPTTIVRVEGYDMEVRTAVQMGYLRRNGEGTYTETTKADRDAAEAAKRHQVEQQQPEQPASSGDVSKMTTTAFHPEIQKDIDQITEGRGEDVWVPAFAEYVTHGNLDRVVGMTGMSREQAEVFVSVAQAAFAAQAQAALSEIVGDDMEGFAGWCVENKPREYQRAVTTHVRARSVDGYKELAAEYQRTVAPSEEMLRKSGYEVAKDRATGELLVKLDAGEWVSVRVATRQGAFVLPRAWEE
jgi:hypothetical protein